MPWTTIPVESFHKCVSIGKMSRNDDRKIMLQRDRSGERRAPAQRPTVQARRKVD